MSKYVDADALSDAIQRNVEAYYSWGGGYDSAEGALSEIENFPAADVVPVRHGKWNRIKIPPAGYNLHGWQCSECGYVDEVSHSVAETAFPYCPNCGAKMDVETP